MDFYQLILIALVVLCASYIQSVTGFGFGIFAMIFLPYILLYTEANALSTILSTFTSITVVLVLFRKINWKNLPFAIIGSSVTTFLSVYFIKSQENGTLTLLLGVALVVLSIYFFFFSNSIKINPTWYAGLIAGVISGFMGGMFSIGGPPMVIYFMQSEEDSDSYLATISAYFVLANIISIATKAAAGFITTNVWLGFAVGFFGMVIGSIVGKLTRIKINSLTLKKAVYAVMALSGVVNIITSLVP